MSTTTDNAQLSNDAVTLDNALLQAEIRAELLAKTHPDPEAADAYRWVSVKLATLRKDAATAGGLES